MYFWVVGHKNIRAVYKHILVLWGAGGAVGRKPRTRAGALELGNGPDSPALSVLEANAWTLSHRAKSCPCVGPRGPWRTELSLCFLCSETPLLERGTVLLCRGSGGGLSERRRQLVRVQPRACNAGVSEGLRMQLLLWRGHDASPGLSVHDPHVGSPRTCQ